MSDITTKTPKAEVLVAYQALYTEHTNFKQYVVDSALKMAEDHDMCDVARLREVHKSVQPTGGTVYPKYRLVKVEGKTRTVISE